MAKLLPTDSQDMERTLVGLAAASFTNPRTMHRSAQVLLDQGLWPPAFSWAALATEEVGKAVNKLHTGVGAHTVTLVQAQSAIATDWTTALAVLHLS